MSRTAARFTQADLARAIRAAKQAGASAVLLLTDGTIRIELAPHPDPAAVHEGCAASWDDV